MGTEIHGFCAPRFAPIRDVFARNFADGLELGASVAATWRGRLVVDLWAGSAHPDGAHRWEQDTLVAVASTTKIMMMIAATIMIDRGLLDVDAPVTRYWPEFAQGGKENVTVRDALTHQAGVPGFAVPLTDDEVCDWARATARLAAEPHWFNGERQMCYHFHTYGYLIGEIIRRVDGRRPRQFIQQEICQPMGADFLLGLTPEVKNRIARLNMPTTWFQGEGIQTRLMNSIDMSTSGSWKRLTAEMPSGNGFSNGRGIALACAIMANGGLAEGPRLLTAEAIAFAGQEHAYGNDLGMGMMRCGLGFGLDSKEFPAPTPTSMHWGGYGGSEGVIDPASGVSFGYAPNNWNMPETPNGQFAIDERIGRFFLAIKEISARL